MSKIESIKAYTGQDLDNIFFRPMLTGKSAEQLGIKIMYNMPVPTVLHFWRRTGDVLQKYTQCGWNGSPVASKYQKTIQLSRVKAESGYAADDYFSTVYDLIVARPDVNIQDLTGTELEEAETSLFRQSIAESIRATMWFGSTERAPGPLNTFNGIIKRLLSDLYSNNENRYFAYTSLEEGWAEGVLRKCWVDASPALKALKPEGELVYFVTSDVYNAYEDSLNNADYESSFIARQNGRSELCYRGIPVVDIEMSNYSNSVTDLPRSLCLLTDRRNLTLAVNTSDFPGTEVRMWYNPDLMENRQRAVFMAGCDYLLPELVSIGVGCPFTSMEHSLSATGATFRFQSGIDASILDCIYANFYDANGDEVCNETDFTISGNVASCTVSGATGIVSVSVTVMLRCGAICNLEYTV